MLEDEADIRDACCRDDRALAVTLVLRRYGPELLGYLTAITPTGNQAGEIYSLVAEDLWRGIAGFEWRCTARAWAYTLARNARARYLAGEGRRAAREELDGQPWLRELVEITRSSTPFHQRTDVKDRLREVRDRLDEPDQTLLMLRVDRGLTWSDLVDVLDERQAGEAAEVAAARLRKRFQALKDRLRRQMVRDGVLHDRG